MNEITGWGAAEAAPLVSRNIWLHCSPGVEIPVLILSDQPRGFYTHWQGRSPRICAGEGCLSCAHGAAIAARIMLSVWDFEACQKVIFEFSDKLALDLAACLPNPANARGEGIVISREGRLKTGRYLVRHMPEAAELAREEFYDTLYETLRIPDAADLVEAVEATARRCGVCDVVRAAPEAREAVDQVGLPGFQQRAAAMRNLTHSLNPLHEQVNCTQAVQDAGTGRGTSPAL
jgi:hypothetical protein